MVHARSFSENCFQNDLQFVRHQIEQRVLRPNEPAAIPIRVTVSYLIGRHDDVREKYVSLDDWSAGQARVT